MYYVNRRLKNLFLHLPEENSMKKSYISFALFAAVLLSAANASCLEIIRRDTSDWPLVRILAEAEGVKPEPSWFRLQLPDAKVLDPVSMRVFKTETPQLNLMLAIDSSRSLSGDDLEALRTALDNYLSTPGDNEKISIISFDDRVSQETDFTSDKARIRQALDSIRQGGTRTSLFPALKDGIDLLKARQGERVLLLVTDGHDESGDGSYAQIARLAARKDVRVYAVGLPEKRKNNSAFLEGLRRLAKSTGGEYMFAENPRELSSAVLTLMRDARLSLSPYTLVELLFNAGGTSPRPEINAILEQRTQDESWARQARSTFQGNDITLARLSLNPAPASASSANAGIKDQGSTGGDVSDSSRMPGNKPYLAPGQQNAGLSGASEAGIAGAGNPGQGAGAEANVAAMTRTGTAASSSAIQKASDLAPTGSQAGGDKSAPSPGFKSSDFALSLLLLLALLFLAWALLRKSEKGAAAPLAAEGNTAEYELEFPERGQCFPLRQGEHHLGSGRDNLIEIHDPTISRVHARLEVGPDGCKVEDSSADKGVFVNETRIYQPVLLEHGDRVRFGEVEAIFRHIGKQ